MSLRDYCFCCLMSSLESYSFIYIYCVCVCVWCFWFLGFLFFVFRCFRQEGKSSSCYSILGRSERTVDIILIFGYSGIHARVKNMWDKNEVYPKNIS